MNNYITLYLKTHPFFGRITKKLFLFLLAGFPAKETQFIQQAGHFQQEFEEQLTGYDIQYAVLPLLADNVLHQANNNAWILEYALKGGD